MYALREVEIIIIIFNRHDVRLGFILGQLLLSLRIDIDIAVEVDVDS